MARRISARIFYRRCVQNYRITVAHPASWRPLRERRTRPTPTAAAAPPSSDIATAVVLLHIDNNQYSDHLSLPATAVVSPLRKAAADWPHQRLGSPLSASVRPSLVATVVRSALAASHADSTSVYSSVATLKASTRRCRGTTP